MTKEIWKDIDLSNFPNYKPSFHGCLNAAIKGYKVSNLGKVINPKGELANIFTRKDGYKSVTVYINGKSRLALVHRLVAVMFCEPPNETIKRFNGRVMDGIPYIVNHKDENPSNNKSDNLEWLDQIGNLNQAYENQTNTRGCPIEILDLATNEKTIFPFTRALGRYLKITQSTASYLLFKHKTLPYLDRYLFREVREGSHKLFRQQLPDPLYVYNIKTNEVTILDIFYKLYTLYNLDPLEIQKPLYSSKRQGPVKTDNLEICFLSEVINKQ